MRSACRRPTDKPGAWRLRVGGAVVALVVLPGAAIAAGGAHVVDDADVETAGDCHVDAWATRYRAGQNLAVLAPACTPGRLPRLELGAALQVQRDAGDSETTLGPAFKFNLLPMDSGLGVAITGTGAWRLRDGTFMGGGLLVPLSVPVGERLRVHLNAGVTQVEGAARRCAFFRGVQVEADVQESVSLMAEAFARRGDPTGYQFGVRWAPLAAPAWTVDVLYGRRIDGSSPDAFTVGLSWRG
jgi:hypothetical protein